MHAAFPAQHLLHKVLEASLDAFMVLTAVRNAQRQIIDFCWLLANSRMQTFTGIESSALIGQQLRSALPDRRLTGFFYDFIQVVETGQPLTQECSEMIAGSRHWFQVTTVKLDDGVAVTFRDISRQRQAEELRLTLAAARIAPFEIVLSTRTVQQSAAMDRMYGLPIRPGPRALDVYVQHTHVDDRAAFLAVFDGASQHHIPRELDYRIVRPDGALRWISLRGCVLQDRADGSLRFIGSLINITERKQAELSFLESHRQRSELLAMLESLLDNAPIGVAFFDKDCRYVRINPTLAEINGVAAADHVGRTVGEVVPANAAAVEPLIKQVFNQSTTIANIEIAGETPAQPGVTRYWLLSLYPVLDQHGTVLFAGAVVVEISDRKLGEQALQAAKEAAERASRTKSIFLSTMSHELRTPLTSMIGYAGLLARRLTGKQLVQAERIEQGGKRLAATLNTVLLFAQLEDDQLELDLKALTLAHELEEAAMFYRDQAEAKGLTLSISVEPEAATGQALLDHAALQNILQNLLSNATKFTESGSITVELAAADGWITLSVSDTGIGIDQEFLPYVFDGFQQESVGLSRMHDGSGLGLAVVKRLVDKMQGHIAVESIKGVGSCFMLRWPLLATAD